MIATVQRVQSAQVNVDKRVVGSVEKGLLVLVGVFSDDTDADAQMLAEKVAKLRIFADSNDKINLSLKDTGSKALAVPNFTLCADVKKGNRPSFCNAMRPDGANQLYNLFVKDLRELGITVECGEFGADMKIHSVLDGPFTITLDTKIWRKNI
ncbi:MAG: D-aminoacyl-tRNA deacylase [bacterium]|nr:D-aminoacyl-tRNA deacylase [bacterium]